MIFDENYQNMTEGFISTQVVSRGLDERTAKAYRIDLEKFYSWLEAGGDKENKEDDESFQQAEKEIKVFNWKRNNHVASVPDDMEAYLNYLSSETGLRQSTIRRKQRVLSYYLTYLASQGVLEQYHSLKPVTQQKEELVDTLLTKKEVDALFRAIDREYEELDSDFRKRVCLRDQVMMKLLFYHGIEVSELLRLEVSDYDRKTSFLRIEGKRGKNRSVYLFSRELQKQMEQWLTEHEYFEREEVHRECMFLSKMGKPLSMKMIINIFDKYRIMAGIEKECKPKDLKNSLGRYAEDLVREQG